VFHGLVEVDERPFMQLLIIGPWLSTQQQQNSFVAVWVRKYWLHSLGRQLLLKLRQAEFRT
jgi:hypothetical protein